MDTKLLEQYYETVVLPLYSNDLELSAITWKDHGKVDLDAWAHYFVDTDDREYILIYEDFPGSDYLNDDLSHDLVKCGDETSVRVTTTPEKSIDNIIGYFTLCKEKVR